VEDVSMSEPKRTAEPNVGAFLGDVGVGLVPMPTNTLHVGPGDPGPEDEWKIPAQPDDEAAGKLDAAPEPATPAHGVGFLHRLTHRG
jgi:hypothetical protein